MMHLAFYRGEGKIVDRLVRWWTQGKYSHCEMVFSDGMYFSADAWSNKVRYATIKANPANWDFVELGINPKEELAVRAWCDSQNGKGYDWVGILLSQILPLKAHSKRRWFCSELCVAALQTVGRLSGIRPQDIDPSELAVLHGL